MKQSNKRVHSGKAAAKRTVGQQRSIQKQVARADARAGRRKESSRAMQAGARGYPRPPFPRQHQAKPGAEASLNPRPMYDAPYYRGSDKLKDKVAIVSGADSGIGRAVALLFAREGADVMVLYLNEHRDAEETRQAIEREGRQCLMMAGDVRNRAFCRRAVARAIARFGKLDILVNNAAFQVHTADFLDLTEKHFDQTLKTNLYGYFHLAQAAVEHMAPGSAIVNTGSVTGILGNKDLLDYSIGDRAGLCVPGISAVLELHHRRGAAHHRRVQLGIGRAAELEARLK